MGVVLPACAAGVCHNLLRTLQICWIIDLTPGLAVNQTGAHLLFLGNGIDHRKKPAPDQTGIDNRLFQSFAKEFGAIAAKE